VYIPLLKLKRGLYLMIIADAAKSNKKRRLNINYGTQVTINGNNNSTINSSITYTIMDIIKQSTTIAVKINSFYFFRMVKVVVKRLKRIMTKFSKIANEVKTPKTQLGPVNRISRKAG
jgi:hypothetical protein